MYAPYENLHWKSSGALIDVVALVVRSFSIYWPGFCTRLLHTTDGEVSLSCAFVAAGAAPAAATVAAAAAACWL